MAGTGTESLFHFRGRRQSLELLPKSDWRIEACGDDHVAVGAWVRNGWLHWKKIARADLPNGIVTQEDLDRFGIARA